MTRSTKQSRHILFSGRQTQFDDLPVRGPTGIEQLSGDAPFGSVGRQMNKLLDHMHKGYFGFHPVETWTPAVNLYETADHYLVCVDLAGVDKDKIDITVRGQQLIFRGHRAVPTHPDPLPGEDILEGADSQSQPPRVRVHLMEIDHGSFSRDVELPEDVEADQIRATHRNGLLWIELPRRSRAAGCE